VAPSGRELPRFDPTTPNEARIHDYLMGGKDNFAADREAAAKVLQLVPDFPMLIGESRRFLDRVVRFLAEAGIRQFIDIGCGLPTRGNVHEIAQSAAPDARVVYVDKDPVVVAHVHALLANSPQTTVIQADARDVEKILADPALTAMVDLDQPVAILLISLLPSITEDDVAAEVVERLRELIPPGSYLVISHGISDVFPEVTAELAAFVQDQRIVTGVRRCNLRARADIEPYFGGLEVVEPGVVHLPEWRPDRTETVVDPQSVWVIGGVGQKTAACGSAGTPVTAVAHTGHVGTGGSPTSPGP
jgi:O-methyltransferase involved in polyketide biosynthesis